MRTYDISGSMLPKLYHKKYHNIDINTICVGPDHLNIIQGSKSRTMGIHLCSSILLLGQKDIGYVLAIFDSKGNIRYNVCVAFLICIK